MERRPERIIITTQDSPVMARSRGSHESTRTPRMHILTRVSSSSLSRSQGPQRNDRSLDFANATTMNSHHILRGASLNPLQHYEYRGIHAPPYIAALPIENLPSHHDSFGSQLDFNFSSWLSKDQLNDSIDQSLIRARRKGLPAKYMQHEKNSERSSLKDKSSEKLFDVNKEFLKSSTDIPDERYLLNQPELLKEFECSNKEKFKNAKQKALTAWFDLTVQQELQKRSMNLSNLGDVDLLSIAPISHEEQYLESNIQLTASEEGMMYEVTQLCRVCLRMENSLTHFSVMDRDNVRFIDKLAACIADVTWQRENYPLLLCLSCIEKLRSSFEFRNLCLQSEVTLQRYVSQEVHENTSSKFDFGLQTDPVSNEAHNPDYLNLKSLLDCTEYSTPNKGLDDEPQVEQVNPTTVEVTPDVIPASQQEAHSNSTRTTTTTSIETQTPYALMTQSNNPLPQPKLPLKRYPCNICSKDYSNYSNLRSHKKSHSGEKPFECKYCDKRFLHPHHLREHIRRHTGEKPFACSLCSKRFTIRGEVTMHMRSHTGEKPYACSFCDKKCSTHSDLKVHVRTHTGEKPFMCNICDKRFASGYILNAHNKTHTGEKPYKCNICFKTFAQSSQLTVHFRTHTGEKPYRCKFCEQTFTRNTELTIHLREHTGKVPYSCSICNRGFVYQSHYQAHMVKHSGEKPYECKACHKKFTTSSYLQEHMRKHTGQKLFSCTHCDKTFTRSGFLQKHIRKHTGEKPFPCTICSKRFSSSNYLSTHMKKHPIPQSQSIPMNNSHIMPNSIMQ